jgi:hypothetical protein
MRRGEVVEVDWPYSDMTGSKKRPAVVVQADFFNGAIDDTILVQITSTRHGLPGTGVLLGPAVETASGRCDLALCGFDSGVSSTFGKVPSTKFSTSPAFFARICTPATHRNGHLPGSVLPASYRS